MPPSAARKIIGTGRLIGVSTHNMNEARSALDQGADFITFGPIYETPEKAIYGTPVGIDALINLKKSITVPIFAIGGIKSGNIGAIFQAGANGVAMISAILAATDIRTAARRVNDSVNLSEKIAGEERSAL
jgi:thiamine-phosphate pyrophosphorylase